ncbi:uncharacterized protein LOC135847674 [Planococcus citri]|uniref:uncharacterized protein LOC135847674 n=1 Tax=Planococcus citri TaxID=170843 RepID=UPI0031F87D93
MKKMTLPIFFQIFVILWCFSLYPVAVYSENALIYSWKYKEIDELKSDDKPCQYCITACPPSSDLEKKFDRNDSIGRIGSSLFLKKIYPDVVHRKDMEVDICNTSFKPVMIWDTKEELHRIGYELYYNEEQKQGSKFELKCDKHDEFRRIVNGEPSILRPVPISENVSKHKDEDGKNTVFEIQTDGVNQKLVFYWLPVLSIKSGISALIVQSRFNHRQITFEKDVINIYPQRETITKCTDYNLGAYSSLIALQATNEEELLKEIEELPSPPNKPIKICKQLENDCMKMTQIMPMLFFHTTASKLATCTYLNLAYIWNSIANGRLKKVDRYLYAMHRIWDSYDMKISFGITGEMDLDVDSISAYTASINLSKDKTLQNFPTPQIIYRIVRYEVDSIIYQTIVVIHNNSSLELAPRETRVCSKTEEVGGWSKIKNQLDEPGLTYACPVTRNSLLYLGIDDHDAVSPSDPLELNAFPEYRNGKIEKVDKTDDIEKQLTYIAEQLGIVD